MLRHCANGFGMPGLAVLLTEEAVAVPVKGGGANPLAVKPPMFPAKRLTYRYGGRDYRLTDVYGNVVKKIIA